MKTLSGKKLIALSVGALMTASSLTGCIYDKLEECAKQPEASVRVKFRFDYNTEAKDNFLTEVKAVTVYVFDQQKQLAIDPIEVKGPEVKLLSYDNMGLDLTSKFYDSKTKKSILPEGNYSIYAYALADEAGYKLTSRADSKTQAYRFTRTDMEKAKSHKVNDFQLTLPYQQTADKVFTVNRPAGAPFMLKNIEERNNFNFENTWVTLAQQNITIPNIPEVKEGDKPVPDVTVGAVVPLIRVNNLLNVAFFYKYDHAEEIDMNNFTVKLVHNKNNADLDILAGRKEENKKLTYEPIYMYENREKVVRDGREETVKVVHAVFGVSRYFEEIISEEDKKEPISQIIVTGNEKVTDKEKETMVKNYVKNYLVAGKSAYQGGDKWSDQEYLDRQSNYEVRFPFGDGTPEWVEISINILSWTKRIQNVDL